MESARNKKVSPGMAIILAAVAALFFGGVIFWGVSQPVSPQGSTTQPIPVVVTPSADDDIDVTPGWYNGSKPWASISEDGRRKTLAGHKHWLAIQAEANKTAVAKADASSAKAGELLVARIVKQYKLDPFYRNPSLFGPKMVLWLPEPAWNKLSTEERGHIANYVSSRYQNWGVGIGRIKGKDVLADQIVVESAR